MPINIYKDGFSYDGFGGGTKEWTAVDIISDISKKELDKDCSYYIDGIGYFEKDEIMGKNSSLEEIYNKNNTDKIEIYGISHNCYIDKKEDGSLGVFKAKFGNIKEYQKPIEHIYELNDGNYSINKPEFLKINLKEYFKDVIEGKKTKMQLTTNYDDVIGCYRTENNKIVVVKYDEIFFEDDAISVLESSTFYEYDGDFFDADNDSIDEWLSENDKLDHQIEQEVDEFEHPENYRDYEDDYE